MDGTIGIESASLVARALGGGRAHEQDWIAHAEESTIKRLREELSIVVRERAVGRRGAEGGPVDDAAWLQARSRRPGDSIERMALLMDVAFENPGADVIIPLRLPRWLASALLSTVGSERRRLDAICRKARSLFPDLDDEQLIALLDKDARNGARLGNGPGPLELVGLGRHRDRPLGYRTPRSLHAALMFSRRSGWVPRMVRSGGPPRRVRPDLGRSADEPTPSRRQDLRARRMAMHGPGCTSRKNLEEHHIVYRSHGGNNRADNLVTLCRYHHQQGEHNGMMRCRGKAPLGITWWMGRDAAGGVFKNERRLLTRAERTSRLHLSA
jgi:hypothetical protein